MSDESALKVGSWPEEETQIVILAIRKITGPKNIREYAHILGINGRAATSVQLPASLKSPLDYLSIKFQKEVRNNPALFGNSNIILKKGAMLHSDIAMLQLDRGRKNEFLRAVISSRDGIGRIKRASQHWDFARLLLDLLKPDPSKDEIVRHWYAATTAYMLSCRDRASAEWNLRRAMDLFPNDAEVLFYLGVFHEINAAPKSQNSLRAPGMKFRFGSRSLELNSARTFLQKAVQINPAFGEAHLRLGRVKSLLDDHEGAVSELQKAMPLLTDSKLKYFNSLFLGHEFASLGRYEEAHECFKQSAALYPNAQSPLLALSQLAINRGNANEAQLWIKRVFALPPEYGIQNDPWWSYELADSNTEALVSEMRKEFGGLSQ